MHARIFEVSKEKVSNEDRITPDLFYEESFLDYCGETETYDDDINYLVEDVLPKGCFSREGADGIRYNGGLLPAIEKWAGDIASASTAVRESAEGISVGNLDPQFLESLDHKLINLSLNIWKLKEAASTPTDESRIWSEEDGTQTIGEWVLAQGRKLKVGDILYLGGIVDFHY